MGLYSIYGPINRGGLRQPLGAIARPKWGDYIEGLLRPKLKVSEDDPDRVHLDLDRQRSKANRSTGRRGMWLIAFIGNELLTNL